MLYKHWYKNNKYVVEKTDMGKIVQATEKNSWAEHTSINELNSWGHERLIKSLFLCRFTNLSLLKKSTFLKQKNTEKRG